MAYSVLEQLKEDALKCELCFEVPGDDDTKNVFKQLRCNHTFCKNCLVKLVKPEGRISCPNCRDETVLDKSVSVDNLPLAFQVTNVIDWINKKQVNVLRDQNSDRQCPEHKVQNNFFCIDCSKYVCGDCLALTHDKKHTSLYIKAEAESMRKEIQKMIKEIDSQLLHWKKAENHKNQSVVRMRADAADAKASVLKCISQVINTLEGKKKSLMNSIVNEYTAKLNAVITEKEEIIHQKKEYETKMETVRRSLEHSDDHEVFKARAAIGKIHKEVFDKLPSMLNQSPADSLRFSPNLITVKRLQTDINKRIGKVHTVTGSIESPIHVRTAVHEDILPAVLKHMERTVTGAYELEVQKLSQGEGRKKKGRFIVNHLQGELGGEWNCIIGDFVALPTNFQALHFAFFLVNDTEMVFVFKNKLNSTDGEKRNAVREDKNIAVPEDKNPRLMHQVASSSSNGTPKLTIKRTHMDMMPELYPYRPSKKKSQIPVAKHGQDQAASSSKVAGSMTKIKTASRSHTCTSILPCDSLKGPRSIMVPKLVIKRTHRDMSEQYPYRPSNKKTHIPVAKHGQNHANLRQQKPKSTNEMQ